MELAVKNKTDGLAVAEKNNRKSKVHESYVNDVEQICEWRTIEHIMPTLPILCSNEAILFIEDSYLIDLFWARIMQKSLWRYRMVFLSKTTPNLPQTSDYKRVTKIEYTTPLSPRFLCGDSNIIYHVAKNFSSLVLNIYVIPWKTIRGVTWFFHGVNSQSKKKRTNTNCHGFIEAIGFPV